MCITNEALVKAFAQEHPGHQEVLLDFGSVPAEPLDQADWKAEVVRLLTLLQNRGYLLEPAGWDDWSTLCPLFTVRLPEPICQTSTPVDLLAFAEVLTHLCHGGQQIRRHERVLHVLVQPEKAAWTRARTNRGG